MKHDHNETRVTSVSPSLVAHATEKGVDVGALADSITHKRDVRGPVRVSTEVEIAQVRYMT